MGGLGHRQPRVVARARRLVAPPPRTVPLADGTTGALLLPSGRRSGPASCERADATNGALPVRGYDRGRSATSVSVGGRCLRLGVSAPARSRHSGIGGRARAVCRGPARDPGTHVRRWDRAAPGRSNRDLAPQQRPRDGPRSRRRAVGAARSQIAPADGRVAHRARGALRERRSTPRRGRLLGNDDIPPRASAARLRGSERADLAPAGERLSARAPGHSAPRRRPTSASQSPRGQAAVDLEEDAPPAVRVGGRIVDHPDPGLDSGPRTRSRPWTRRPEREGPSSARSRACSRAPSRRSG